MGIGQDLIGRNWEPAAADGAAAAAALDLDDGRSCGHHTGRGGRGGVDGQPPRESRLDPGKGARADRAGEYLFEAGEECRLCRGNVVELAHQGRALDGACDTLVRPTCEATGQRKCGSEDHDQGDAGAEEAVEHGGDRESGEGTLDRDGQGRTREDAYRGACEGDPQGEQSTAAHTSNSEAVDQVRGDGGADDEAAEESDVLASGEGGASPVAIQQGHRSQRKDCDIDEIHVVTSVRSKTVSPIDVEGAVPTVRTHTVATAQASETGGVMYAKHMAKDETFDITTGADLQEVDNAINQARKEISTRFDFKNVLAEIEWDKTKAEVTVHTTDEYKLDAIWQVLTQRFIARNVPLKNLVRGAIEQAAQSSVRQRITLTQAIESDVARKIVKDIKEQKYKKVQASVQGDAVRIASPSRDELQQVIAQLKANDYGIELKFGNYR